LQLKDEDHRLKLIVSDLKLDNEALKESSKTSNAQGAARSCGLYNNLFWLSQRRATNLVGLNQNTLRRKRQPNKRQNASGQYEGASRQTERFCYRGLHPLLKRGGMVVNKKRTKRI
jgi:hypothetical protein